ncbi:MAG TPA: phosphopantetheine-binding protein [Opitutaceae bacterium]|jgi:acyl carrier protein
MEPIGLNPDEVVAQLQAKLPEKRRCDTAFVAPRSALERILVESWAEVLGVDKVGIDDDFFALGGDSLHMTQIIGRVREKCGAELSFEDFFSTPTIVGLALSAARSMAPLQ